MSEIRPITEQEIESCIALKKNAYPGLEIDAALNRERILQGIRDPSFPAVYGLFREGQMVGSMKLYQYTMNFHGGRLPVGGLGDVAVDLVHKKKKICAEMVRFCIDSYRQQKRPCVLLYPFRPDFYKRMGWGFGPKMHQYRLKPDQLPVCSSWGHVRWLAQEQRPSVAECYQRFFQRQHGLLAWEPWEMQWPFEFPGNQTIGYQRSDSLEGYLVFSFRPTDHPLQNDILIRELIYSDPLVLRELLGFLRSQLDQVNRVILQTADDNFHFLLADPRDDSNRLIPSVYHQSDVSGVGLMVRIVDLPGFFQATPDQDWNGQTIAVTFTISDSFFPANEGSTTVEFRRGRATVAESKHADTEIRLDISDLSSLLVGAVDFGSLYRLGLVEVSASDSIGHLEALFRSEKPICTTGF
jgi:predicted acetyltransferase